MARFILLLLPFLLFSFATSLPQSAPKSLFISYIQKEGNCSYKVDITTSCLSPSQSKPEIGILFGDSHGNQIYEPKLKIESSITFGKCRKDSFQLEGPCADEICLLYLYRNSSENWIADSVQISSTDIKAVEFKFNSSIPSNTWYGFDKCQYFVPPPPPPPALPPPSAAAHVSSRKWFASMFLVLLSGSLM